MGKGKLIVLEGIDGSGKSTQYRRLCDRMEREKIAYNHIVFPRYEKESSALIRLYLSGAFGKKPGDVNAYTASTFYAVDRFASYRDDWGAIYEKLPDAELPAFFDWLADLEYGKMGLPEPDLVIYLDVDLEVSRRRMRYREEKNHTSADIHEQDSDYLARCLHTADMACRHYGWLRIPWQKDGEERDVDEKNAEIYDVLLRELGNK